MSDRHKEMAVDKAEQISGGDFTFSFIEKYRFQHEKCEPAIVLDFGR